MTVSPQNGCYPAGHDEQRPTAGERQVSQVGPIQGTSQPEQAERQSSIPELASQILGDWQATIRCIALLLAIAGFLVLVTYALACFQVDLRVGPLEVIGRHLVTFPLASTG